MKKTYRNLSVRILTGLFTLLCLPGAVTMNNAVYAEALPSIGFYRTMVGDFEVTALTDGTNKRTIQQQLQLLQGDKDKIEGLLLRSYPDGQIESAVNAYLINTGSKLVLVDTGNGKMGSPTMGNIVQNLLAAGYLPEKIDEIYLTHMHTDHVGGLVSGTERTFPNATVYANKTEADYWLDENNLSAAPDAAKRTFAAAKATLAPYIAAGKFKTFAGGANLIPGIRAEDAIGHTPGHTMYFVESQGKTLVLWGDIVHVAAVQFENPDVAISFDSNTEEAVKSRQHILADAAKSGWLIGGVHLSFPGFGYAKAKAGQGYIFMPLADLAAK